MFALLLRGFFLVGIISWYSTGVWKFIDDYFRNEFKSYLSKEFKRNKHLQLKMEDVPTEIPKSSAVEENHSPDIAESFINKHQVETCERDLWRSPEKLDYHNYQRTNNRQSGDDDRFVNYVEHKVRDNSDFNLHCRAEEANCEDNDQLSF